MTDKHKKRTVIDEDEITREHFSRLERLLREEEREDRGKFKTEYLDKKPEERERGGKALLRLVLLEMHFNPSGHRLLTLGFPDRRPLPRYTFRAGDVVKLSGFQTAETERPVGTVYDRSRFSIIVAFTARLPGWVGHEQFYHLNLSENQTTYQRMYESLKEVREASHSHLSYLRHITLGLRKPRIGEPIAQNKIEFLNSNLNEDQRQAVIKALAAEDILLIHGPPGTGKTLVLVEIIRQAKRLGQSVLVSAPSNAACDNVVDYLVAADVPVTRLGHPARMTERIRDHTLSFKLARHPFAKMIEENEARIEQLERQKERRSDRRVMTWEEKRALHEERVMLRKDIRNLKNEIFHQVWNVSDVVVATHTGCGDPILKARHFDWVMIDEATQAVEPGTWIPLLRGRKVILAGDHCQLPPTVFSPKTGRQSLRFSLFERLHEVLNEESKIRLKLQYRMNEKIMQFSSREFYEGELVAHPSVQTHTLRDLPGIRHEELTESPVLFLDTAGMGYEEKTEPGGVSRYNEDEAKLVEKEYQRLLRAGVPADSIAIISPYSAQVKLLAGRILPDREEAPDTRLPEIDSIDAFQGREKEVVIVSLVRSNTTGQLGFLADTRRMNVAMTRAKRKLIVIGDSGTISTLDFYQDFLNYVESVGGYHSAWEDI